MSSTPPRKRVTFADLVSAKPPSTEVVAVHNSQEGPSTSQQDSRPQRSLLAVHSLPSTSQTESRPQLEHLPSTTEFDGKPSTNRVNVDGKPSTRRAVAVRKKKNVAVHNRDRHRADRARYDNRIDPTIYKQIKAYCVDRGITQQDFAELSAVHFLEAVAVHKNQNVDGLPSLDDRDMMIMYKTSPAIINIYVQYNPENRWKPSDDRVAFQYNSTDLRAIEIGIIQTQFNARFKKINSFQYYVPEIEECKTTPLASETLDIMLKQHRRRWQAARPGGGLEEEERE